MIRINDIHISYSFHDSYIEALQGVSFDINDGDYVAMIGPSGSGKSTLISAVAGLIFPDKGDIFLDKARINRISRRKRAKLRAQNYGIIFQFSELINRFSVAENLKLAFEATHPDGDRETYMARLEYLSGFLELDKLLKLRPGRLSGGQLQKCAIARALIKDPPVILADEPSGDLDPDNIKVVQRLLKSENEAGKTIFMVTHDMNLAFDATTVYELRDGQISQIIKQ